MTPQVKAKELVDKFYGFNIYKEGQLLSIFECNQLAIITVDELIDCTHSEDIVQEQIGANGKDRNGKYTYEYWQQVKQELQKVV